MPYLIALLGVIGAIGVWWWRIRMAKVALGAAVDAAKDVRLAARRFGFKNKTNAHPADAVEDPRLAAAGIIAAVAEMDGPLGRAELDTLMLECRRVFGVPADEAMDMVSFGRWVAGQCGTPDEAVRRLLKIVRAKAGPDALPDLLAMMETVAKSDGAELTERQTEAMAQAKRVLAAQ